MFKLGQKAIEIARHYRVDFADIRIIEERRQGLGVKNAAISSLYDQTTLGYGVRVLYRGAWGFAACDRMTPAEVQKTALRAIAIAKASRLLMSTPVRLAQESSYSDFWQTPFLKDPFAVAAEKKLELLFAVDGVLRRNRKIKSAEANMRFIREHQWHLTTEGSRIEQVLLSTGAGYSATAVENGEVQVRSYPSTHGGQTLGGGYELIETLNLLENAERVREEAVALLSAPQCPQGEKDLIIGGNQLALQIHESVGHPSELDRVLGYEESYAGSSFATTEKLGVFRYGSPLVNLVADATLPGGLATAGYDDDAVKAQRWHIVKEGVLSGYMTNREFCGVIGETRSKGSCRADGYANIPITRICNLSLMPGTTPFERLLGETRDGVLMDNNKSWSIDQRRLNFQFGCEAAWLVKNGKKKNLVKNPTYQGITPKFWNSCDAIADHSAWRLWGVANCGKGQPGQTAMMCHGSSPARFRKVKIGISG
ncbi:MAG: peptidase C69 [Elusimicrobia bacterium RIFOXYA2_FULL_58_8]|nr:MAG: peptidase C69 [Elusimicrobia bacterium RIFOXYA12_FULL_57_11]OGS14487.1 MAG: peptidase C69 [Elusimicrobia bacterium RIFOXYA2_FULL_58_8]